MRLAVRYNKAEKCERAQAAHRRGQAAQMRRAVSGEVNFRRRR